MTDEVEVTSAQGDVLASRRRAADEWQARMREDIHRRVAERSAAEARLRYRIERAAEGSSVLPYHFHKHAPQQLGETLEIYQRRLHRDVMRTRRGKDAATVRPRTDLSLMSEAERAEHRRKVDRERQRRRREKLFDAAFYDGLDHLVDELMPTYSREES